MSDIVEFLRAQYQLDRDFAIVARLSDGRRRQLLADVESKRRILELHLNNDEGQTGTCSTCTDRDYLGLVDDEWPCQTLRLLALPYVSHPDYREEWRL